MRLLIFACIGMVMSGCSPLRESNVSRSSSRSDRNHETARYADWVDSTLARMTVREKAAQLFIIWTRAGYMPNDSRQWQENLRYAKDVGVGGFYFSHGSVYGFPVNANKLQQAADIPLLMTADFEWGAGMRIADATTFPKAMALGATRDTNLAYELGKAVAVEARALGIHQNYSPVVDINNNPRNPVINTRSFGEDARLVAEFSRAFIRGSQEGNLIATVKHFPGHGDTDIDTHLDLPTVQFTKERFDSLELVPYRDAIAHGVMSVMVAHIHAEAFDASDSIPSTASVNVITHLLRHELKFDGMIVTDALAMKGMSNLYSPGEAALRALSAGADVLLMSPNADEAIDSIVAAVTRGEITSERLDASVRKILRYKQWCGLDVNRFVNVDSVSARVATDRHQALAKRIARQSITVLGNSSGVLPLSSLDKRTILHAVFSDTEDPSEAAMLHAEFSKRKRMERIRIDPRSNQMDFDELIKKAGSADIIICQFMYYTRSEKMTGTIPKKVMDAMTAMIALKKPVITVSLGNPYIVMDFPKTEAYVAAYSLSNATVTATAEVIFGEQPARGKLPISIPDRYTYGEGVTYDPIVLREGTPADAGMNGDSLRRVDALIQSAVADSSFPGAVLLVAKDGIVVHEKAYGRFTYEPSSPLMSNDALFDLASVTKVAATTSAVMKLVSEKRISLNDKVSTYLPSFGQNGKEQITIYNLLVHNSGLQGWRKFYEFCDTPECVMDSIFASRLVYPTGDSTIYSDLGMITAGKIVEAVTGTTLARYCDSVIFKPLNMLNTMFNPPADLRKRIVPTEVDTYWKKTNTAVRGRVHDENAAVLGGISGHAGLFSTASDLAALLQMELNYGKYNNVRILDSATVALFTQRQSDRSSRGIGWDTKSSQRSMSGQFASMRTFLHTGFTGTSVIVDPEKNIIVVFLTNRVHPSRNNQTIGRVRTDVHEAVYRSLQK